MIGKPIGEHKEIKTMRIYNSKTFIDTTYKLSTTQYQLTPTSRLNIFNVYTIESTFIKNYIY